MIVPSRRVEKWRRTGKLGFILGVRFWPGFGRGGGGGVAVTAAVVTGRGG